MGLDSQFPQLSSFPLFATVAHQMCFSDLEQALQVLFREWREEVKESEKIQGDTITDLDKVSKELLQYEATLQQRIAETKENVRKLLKSS